MIRIRVRSKKGPDAEALLMNRRLNAQTPYLRPGLPHHWWVYNHANHWRVNLHHVNDRQFVRIKFRSIAIPHA